MPALSKAFHYRFFMPRRSPATPPGKPDGLASSAFARHYLRNLGWFLFLQVLRCFTSLSLASVTYGFSNRYMDITPCGLPHSDISGSKLVCSSPKLIAAYRVLLRLLVPRHPSCALSSLTTKKQSLKNCLPVSQHKLLTFADIYISLNINFFLAEFSSRHFLQLSIIHSYLLPLTVTFTAFPWSLKVNLLSNMLPHE